MMSPSRGDCRFLLEINNARSNLDPPCYVAYSLIKSSNSCFLSSPPLNVLSIDYNTHVPTAAAVLPQY